MFYSCHQFIYITIIGIILINFFYDLQMKFFFNIILFFNKLLFILKNNQLINIMSTFYIILNYISQNFIYFFNYSKNIFVNKDEFNNTYMVWFDGKKIMND